MTQNPPAAPHAAPLTRRQALGLGVAILGVLTIDIAIGQRDRERRKRVERRLEALAQGLGVDLDRPETAPRLTALERRLAALEAAREPR